MGAFIFEWIFRILGGNEDNHKISDQVGDTPIFFFLNSQMSAEFRI